MLLKIRSNCIGDKTDAGSAQNSGQKVPDWSALKIFRPLFFSGAKAVFFGTEKDGIGIFLRRRKNSGKSRPEMVTEPGLWMNLTSELVAQPLPWPMHCGYHYHTCSAIKFASISAMQFVHRRCQLNYSVYLNYGYVINYGYSIVVMS